MTMSERNESQLHQTLIHAENAFRSVEKTADDIGSAVREIRAGANMVLAKILERLGRDRPWG